MRHAKLLETDKAWEVFEQLEDSYFKNRGNTGFELVTPKDYPSALRALADQHELAIKLESERNHAIATKAYISDKKTATAMATASTKSREAEKLKEQIGESKNYASVKAVEKATGRRFNWRELKKWCLAHGKAIKDIADANYVSVKIYPKDAWYEVYGVKLAALFGQNGGHTA